MYSLTTVCISDVLSNIVVVKNSFHIKDMNAVSPLYEFSGVSSELKPTKYFAALMTCIQFLSSVDVHVHFKGF